MAVICCCFVVFFVVHFIPIVIFIPCPSGRGTTLVKLAKWRWE
jgi:hypothetical protein